MKKILSLTFVIVFGLVYCCYALKTKTHDEINEHIARNTFFGFSLDGYLKYELEIQDGIEHIFNSREAWWLLGKGGKYEDKPWYRSSFHFHNPLTKKGWWGTRESSSIQWSQKSPGTQRHGGNYSWFDVRDYFLKALTSETKTERDKNFADTFRGLGQLMHLVEDLSVPAHTRGDWHIFAYNYEDWVVDNIKPSSFSQFSPVLLTEIGRSNTLAPVPIANLFDTNQYEGDNPDITIESNIGLSEYTNANFFSLDTVFRYFPYPSRNSVKVSEYDIPDPRDPSRTVSRLYYYEKISDGDKGYRLATVPILADNDLDETEDTLVDTMPSLDHYVYKDYASKLLPRAVTYSAGLLMYFFRGKLEVELLDGGLKITNKSEETMHDGVFELYYDNEDGNRQKRRIDSGAEATTLEPDDDQTITFDPPGDAAYYILVYTGGLGNETDAVVGKVVKVIYHSENLIINGDCELDSVWNLPIPRPTEFSEQSSEQAHGGTYSWKIGEPMGTGTNYTVSNKFSVVEGRVYNVSLWVYPGDDWSEDIYDNNYGYVRFYYGAHGDDGWYRSKEFGLADDELGAVIKNEWNHLTFQHIADETGNQAKLGIAFDNYRHRFGTYLYFDDVSVTEAN